MEWYRGIHDRFRLSNNSEIMKHFDLELVSGNVYRSVWKLAWPAMTLNLVNGLHGFVDHVLVGHFLGYAANAAIGIAWQLYLVLMVFIASLFNGMAVLVARYAGRQDREALNRIVYHTFLSMVYVFGIFAVPLGFFVAPRLLPYMNPSIEVQENALPYLLILFTCSAPLFLMIMVTNALQAAGDPRTPMKLGVLATTLNIVISALLITGAGPLPAMGTMAPAIGTCAAPLVSVVIVIVLAARGRLIIQLPHKLEWIPDWSIVKVITRIGIPTGLQAVLLNLGGVMLTVFIGRLDDSVAAQAAYTICYSQLFSFVTWASFGLRASAATMMGQNIGAGRPERGKAGVYIATVVAFFWASVLGLLFLAVPKVLLGLFGATEGTVVDLGVSLLRYLALSGIFVATTLALTGGLQGAGDTKRPMVIAFLTQIVVLLGFCAVAYWMDMLTPQLVWLAILLSHASRFALTYGAFRQGRWAHIKLDLGA